jgi:protein TonB
MDVFSLPDMEIPPPPDEIARPVAPIPVAEVAADALTIPPTTIDRNPADLLRPPGTGARADRQSVPFTPMTVRPYLQNAEEIARALERFYPHALRQAGIGGTVHVWFHIDRDGRVAGTRLNESSGYDAFDEAALRVASQMRFSPAYNRDERVPVWVNIPITFEVQD